MSTFGFIGFGSMAKMLIYGLIKYANVSPHNIYVTRKNKDRLNEIENAFKDVVTVSACQDIVKNAQLVFLCVKPAEIKNVLLEIAPFVNDDTHIISLAGTVSMSSLQSVIHGKITKYMPTEIGACGHRGRFFLAF